MSKPMLRSNHLFVHTPRQMNTRSYFSVWRFYPYLIAFCDAQFPCGLGVNGERIAPLDLQQPWVVLRSRMGMTRLFPIDQVQRILGVGLPVAGLVHGQWIDGIAIGVFLFRPLCIK